MFVFRTSIRISQALKGYAILEEMKDEGWGKENYSLVNNRRSITLLTDVENIFQ